MLDALQPGDVVLSGGWSPKALLIQLFTGSRFSHAALVFDPLVWFEAVSLGIQFTPATATLAVSKNKLHCVSRIPIGHWVSVVRPKRLNEISVEMRYSILDSFVDTSNTCFLFDYPQNDAFLDIIKFGLGRIPLVRNIVRLLFRRKNVVLPGPFCSQLIVEFLRKAGVPTFGNRKPSSITPGAIWRSNEFEFVKAETTNVSGIHSGLFKLREDLDDYQDALQKLLAIPASVAPARKVLVLLDQGWSRFDQLLATAAKAELLKKKRNELSNTSEAFRLDSPVGGHIASTLWWWRSFRSTQSCATMCTTPSDTWNCDKFGCKTGFVEWKKFIEELLPAERQFWAKHRVDGG